MEMGYPDDAFFLLGFSQGEILILKACFSGICKQPQLDGRRRSQSLSENRGADFETSTLRISMNDDESQLLVSYLSPLFHVKGGDLYV